MLVHENPTGMFSKAGRFSIEMFSLLQEKDNIMNGNRRVVRDHSVHMKATTQYTKEKEIPKKPSFQELRETQPFAKIISRDQVDYLMSKNRINNQKFGMYNPKYHFIFEKSPFYQDQDYLEEQRQVHSKKNESLSPKDKPNIQKANSPKKILVSNNSTNNIPPTERTLQGSRSEPQINFSTHQKGIVDFSKMRSRPPLLSLVDPHEKRFEYIEYPDNYTKTKKPLNVIFKRSSNEPNYLTLKQSGLQYDVNYDAIMPKSNKSIMKFEKSPPRRFPMKPIYTLDESLADCTLFPLTSTKSPTNNNSQIIKKVPGSVQFRHQIPRDGSSRILPTEMLNSSKS